MDFESPDAGRLARIIAPVGEPVAVKELIALLADNDADADAYLAGQGGSTPAISPAAESHKSDANEWVEYETIRSACCGDRRGAREGVASRTQAGR